jgi:hypothetical protein
LSAEDLQLLETELTLIELQQGDTLHRQLERISDVYFPVGGVISLVVVMSEGQSVEAALTGWMGPYAGAVLSMASFHLAAQLFKSRDQLKEYQLRC